MGAAAKALRLAAAISLFLPLAHPEVPPIGAIEGDVVDGATGRGIAGARVRIQSGKDDALFAIADEQGHFRFSELEVKAYQAEAAYPGFISARKAAGQNGGEMVSLGAFRPSAEIRLEMRRYGVIVGTVTDSVGVAAEGVLIGALQRFPIGERGHNGGGCNLASQEGDSQYSLKLCVRTDDLGEYRLGPLPAGSYYVGADPQPSLGQVATRLPPDPSERATFYPHSLKASEARPVTVAEGKELRVDIQIAHAGGVTVRGRILGWSAGNAAGPRVFTTVNAIPLSAGAMPQSALEMSGDRFQFTDLMPGTYRLDAFQNVATDSPFDPSTLSAARATVEVGTSDIDGIDLTLAGPDQ